MLSSSPASTGFSKKRGQEQSYYYYHQTRNAKLFFVILHFAIAVGCEKK